MSKNAEKTPDAALKNSVARSPLIPALVWIGLVFLTIVLTWCRRFTVFYGVYLFGSLGIIALSLYFLNELYRKGNLRLFAAFKKFTGYAIVALYILHCLPRVDWVNAGLLNPGWEIFVYVLTLLCTAAGITSFVIMSRKPVLIAFGVMSEEEARDPALLKKNRKQKRRGPLAVILEWVDIIAYAVIFVLLFQIFVLQPFMVPSESMVPVFLGGDRPITVEFLCAPRLPLTRWRLPMLRQPRRGDVVMIVNQRYPENHGVNLKKYLAQAIYKVTLTLVNIDKTTAQGGEKADPLVKRIVGMPGEKLMMVDDVLYARTAKEAEFRPVEADVKRYAQVDLWKLPADVLSKVNYKPIDSRWRDILDAWDRKKNAADPAVLAADLAQTWADVKRRASQVGGPTLAEFERTDLPRAGTDVVNRVAEMVTFAPAGAENPLSYSGVGTDDLALALAVIKSSSARAALEELATAGAKASAGSNAYERGSRCFNLLLKSNLLDRVERDVDLIALGAGLDQIESDARRQTLVEEARELNFCLRVYDMRNFPEFPAGNAFLGPEEYFGMGDNRYNSHDFRYADVYRKRALDPADPASIRYQSNLGPFALEKDFIDGYAVVRFWPPSRIGLIR